jgi:predicted site-specific integrase-resolvase
MDLYDLPDTALVSRREAEKILNVHAHTVRAWLKTGKLAGLRTSDAKNAKMLIFAFSIKNLCKAWKQ